MGNGRAAVDNPPPDSDMALGEKRPTSTASPTLMASPTPAAGPGLMARLSRPFRRPPEGSSRFRRARRAILVTAVFITAALAVGLAGGMISGVI